jgi:hypothetical protein
VHVTGVTLDIDWAPDVVIDRVAGLLVERGVPASWFITHRSAAVERLRDHPELFELGIHPNFLPGSTQGRTHEEVLEHCLELVPDAISMRTHSLYQSTPLLALVAETTPIEVDASLLLLGATIASLTTFTWNGRTLTRVPVYWEDDLAMEEANASWSFDPAEIEDEGVRIYDFHPIHIYLNSSEMGPYRALRSASRPMADDVETLAAYAGSGAGTGTLFVELLDHLADRGDGVRVRDLRVEAR